jgi:hypothetical protein
LLVVFALLQPVTRLRGTTLGVVAAAGYGMVHVSARL